MHQRRKATRAELEQGQREMEAAQQRLDKQVLEGEELPLDDAQPEKVADESRSSSAVHPHGLPTALACSQCFRWPTYWSTNNTESDDDSFCGRL